MVDSIDFEVSEELRSWFFSDRSEFCRALSDLLEAALKKRPEFFRFDCNEARGEIQEETISVEDLEITDTGDGTAFYGVDEYVWMGCQDINGTTCHSGELKFSYDSESGEIEIPFRELPERPFDDI